MYKLVPRSGELDAWIRTGSLGAFASLLTERPLDIYLMVLLAVLVVVLVVVPLSRASRASRAPRAPLPDSRQLTLCALRFALAIPACC